MKNEHDIIDLLDKACILVSSLQEVLKHLKETVNNTEDGFLQQCLDQEDLYMKKIPHVS